VLLCNRATSSRDWKAFFELPLILGSGRLGSGRLGSGRLGHVCLLCVNKLIFIMEPINT